MDLINSYSNEGDTVLDIFSGSGTTAKVCMLNKRDFIACELSEEYYKLSLSRLDKYRGVEDVQTL